MGDISNYRTENKEKWEYTERNGAEVESWRCVIREKVFIRGNDIEVDDSMIVAGLIRSPANFNSHCRALYFRVFESKFE